MPLRCPVGKSRRIQARSQPSTEETFEKIEAHLAKAAGEGEEPSLVAVGSRDPGPAGGPVPIVSSPKEKSR